MDPRDFAISTGFGDRQTHSNFLGIHLFGDKKKKKTYDEEILPPKGNKFTTGALGAATAAMSTGNSIANSNTGDSNDSSDLGIGINFGNLFGPNAKKPKSGPGLEYTPDFDLNREDSGIGLNMQKVNSIYTPPKVTMPKLTDFNKILQSLKFTTGGGSNGSGNNSTAGNSTAGTNNNLTQPVTPVQPVIPGAGMAEPQQQGNTPPKKDNTKTYLIVGAIVLALGIIAIAATSGNKQQPIIIPAK